MEPRIKALFNDDILTQAGACFGVLLHDISFVGGFENFIYGFEKNQQSYILRISHTSHRTIEDTRAELDFVHYLANHGAHVSQPIASIHNRMVEPILAIDGSYFTASCYHKAKGEQPTRSHLSESFLFNYGRTIGQFHRLTCQYQPSLGIQKRFVWDQDPLLVHAKSYLDQSDDVIFDRFRETVDEINLLPHHQDNYGLIHTDIHMGNFFIDHDTLTVFDFDDCAYMHMVSDIAIALFYTIVFMRADEDEKKRKADEFMTHFMKGYRLEYQLSKADYLEIEKFLKLREMVLYIVLFRSADLKTNDFARRYVEFHRERIINRVPVIDIDFEKYYT